MQLSSRYEENAIVFYKEDKNSEYDKVTLYVTVSIHHVELRRGLIDTWSSLLC